MNESKQIFQKKHIYIYIYTDIYIRIYVHRIRGMYHFTPFLLKPFHQQALSLHHCSTPCPLITYFFKKNSFKKKSICIRRFQKELGWEHASLTYLINSLFHHLSSSWRQLCIFVWCAKYLHSLAVSICHNLLIKLVLSTIVRISKQVCGVETQQSREMMTEK